MGAIFLVMLPDCSIYCGNKFTCFDNRIDKATFLIIQLTEIPISVKSSQLLHNPYVLVCETLRIVDVIVWSDQAPLKSAIIMNYNS